MRWLVVLLLLPGCAEWMPTPGASQWTWEQSDSMLPDFEGEGTSFPVIVIHAHAEWSQRQREEFEKNPWVCFTADVPVAAGSSDAGCAPPPVDPPTGRIFVEQAEFRSWGAEAVAIVGKSCGSALVPITGSSLRFQTTEHDFQIEWNGRHFVVEGRALHKGEVLKATYWVDKGDEMDQRFVRVSFDFPGYWLESNVGAPRHPHEERSVPDRASFVEDRLLELEMAAHVSTLGDALQPLAAAMRGSDLRLVDASIAVAGGRITELVATLRSDQDAVRWYMASRDGDRLRVLGNNTVAVGPGVAWQRATAHFDTRPLGGYAVDGADPIASRFVFAPHAGFDAAALGLLQRAPPPDTGCTQCIYLLSDSLSGTDFHYAPDAVAVEVEDAPTWQVHHHQADGTEVRGSYQAALKAS